MFPGNCTPTTYLDKYPRSWGTLQSLWVWICIKILYLAPFQPLSATVLNYSFCTSSSFHLRLWSFSNLAYCMRCLILIDDLVTLVQGCLIWQIGTPVVKQAKYTVQSQTIANLCLKHWAGLTPLNGGKGPVDCTTIRYRAPSQSNLRPSANYKECKFRWIQWLLKMYICERDRNPWNSRNGQNVE